MSFDYELGRRALIDGALGAFTGGLTVIGSDVLYEHISTGSSVLSVLGMAACLGLREAFDEAGEMIARLTERYCSPSSCAECQSSYTRATTVYRHENSE